MPHRFSTQFSKTKDGHPFFSPVMEDGAGHGDRPRPSWRKRMARVHGASAKSTCLTASAPTRWRTFSPIACSNPRATGERRSAICSRKRRDKLGVAPRPQSLASDARGGTPLPTGQHSVRLKPRLRDKNNPPPPFWSAFSIRVRLCLRLMHTPPLEYARFEHGKDRNCQPSRKNQPTA